MNPPSGSSSPGAEGNLMQVLTGILEDSVQTLKRIEKAVTESTKFMTEMLDKLDLIDKKIESGFVAVVKKALPSLEQKFLDKISNVGGEMGDLTTLLPDIITKLQQSMQILSIQTLIKELETVPGGKKKDKAEKVAADEEAPPKTTKKKGKTPPKPPKAPPEKKKPEKAEEAKDEGDHLLKPSSFFGS
ncbi:MAG: hypothetical protein HWN65_07110 [Candidatus Helarchaeota archaeon]|nr:hypothetical protein [Candidatus Helarchaeota archaeon]